MFDIMFICYCNSTFIYILSVCSKLLTVIDFHECSGIILLVFSCNQMGYGSFYLYVNVTSAVTLRKDYTTSRMWQLSILCRLIRKKNKKKHYLPER